MGTPLKTYLPNDLNFNSQKADAFLGGAVVTNSWVLNSLRIMFFEKIRSTDFLKCPRSDLNFSRDFKLLNLDFDLDCSSQRSDAALYLQNELQLCRRSVVILNWLNGFQSALQIIP